MVSKKLDAFWHRRWRTVLCYSPAVNLCNMFCWVYCTWWGNVLNESLTVHDDFNKYISNILYGCPRGFGTGPPTSLLWLWLHPRSIGMVTVWVWHTCISKSIGTVVTHLWNDARLLRLDVVLDHIVDELVLFLSLHHARATCPRLLDSLLYVYLTLQPWDTHTQPFNGQGPVFSPGRFWFVTKMTRTRMQYVQILSFLERLRVSSISCLL